MFSSDMTEPNWVDNLSNAKKQLANALDNAYAVWAQWNDFTYGLNTSSIMQLGPFGTRNFSDVSKIQSGFGNLKAIYDVVNGNTAVSSPYNFMGPLAPFN